MAPSPVKVIVPILAGGSGYVVNQLPPLNMGTITLLAMGPLKKLFRKELGPHILGFEGNVINSLEYVTKKL